MPETTKDVYERIKKAIIEEDPTAPFQIYGLQDGVIEEIYDLDFRQGKEKKALLHIAIEKADVESCRALYFTGANENVVDANRNDSFDIACATGNIECAKLFARYLKDRKIADLVKNVESVPDPAKREELKNFIDSICGRGWEKEKSIEDIYKRWSGVKAELAEEIDAEKIKKAVADGYPVNFNWHQGPLLFDAIYCSNKEAINTLIDLGADVNWQGALIDTPYFSFSPFAAACHHCEIEAAKILVDRGARLDIPSFIDDSFNDDGVLTPIQMLERDCEKYSDEKAKEELEELKNYIIEHRGALPEYTKSIFPPRNEDEEELDEDEEYGAELS